MGDELPADPVEAGLRLARSFEDYGVPYALGGALAFGVWAIPRATVDVDVNVFVTNDKLDSVFGAVTALGIEVDQESARSASIARGMFALKWGRWRIDVFTPSIPFSWEAARTRSSHVIDGQAASFLSAEALAVFKLLFFRPKDIVDLQRLLAVQGSKLDRTYIRNELTKMMGEDDVRVAKWDELVASAP